jgi:hypothetical protein
VENQRIGEQQFEAVSLCRFSTSLFQQRDVGQASDTLFADCKRYSDRGSSSHLVIQTHQEGMQNTFIRSSSDFLMHVYNSAIPGSPNVRKTQKMVVSRRPMELVMEPDAYEESGTRRMGAHHPAQSPKEGDVPRRCAVLYCARAQV